MNGSCFFFFWRQCNQFQDRSNVRSFRHERKFSTFLLNYLRGPLKFATSFFFSFSVCFNLINKLDPKPSANLFFKLRLTRFTRFALFILYIKTFKFFFRTFFLFSPRVTVRLKPSQIIF